MQRTTNWWLFWSAASFIIYTYIGFPLILALRGLLQPKPFKRGQETPLVSLIIVAFNEAPVIIKKLDNACALDYPRDRLEIIVASDGSDDGMNELVAAYDAPQIRLLVLPRQGKNRSLNAAVAAAQGEILVFSDADSMLAPDALRHLVAPFADPAIGGVGGNFCYATNANEGTGEQAYWNIDRVLKQLQSRAENMTSATGQIYAIRRALFKPVPMSVTDDFYTSVQVVSAHRRLVFEPLAVARGPVAASSNAEFHRKVRVMTRGLNGVRLSSHLLNPFQYGFFAIQLLSHKVLRRLMAIPLFMLAATAPLLWARGRFYRIATLLQFGLHGAALVGLLARETRIGKLKIFSLPFFFDMVNIASLVAATNVLRGKRQDVWVTQRAAVEDVAANQSQNGQGLHRQ
ncbi:MAG: glycosyltransferase family 2 protein [Roseiflexaceae bacterium]|nr:glycosyltransferase family 2 protein [Roseiflexaceae bacterium]